MSDNERLTYIDVAKGIAIILVIVGHCIGYTMYRTKGIVDNTVVECINSFHMPLFFVAGGVIYKRREFGVDLKNKLFSLAFPWFLWIFINYIIKLILYSLLGWEIIDQAKYERFSYIFCLRGLWFVQAFLIVFIAYRIMDYYLRNRIVLSIIIVIFLFVGLWTSKYHIDFLPEYCLHTLIGLFFYHFGNVLGLFFSRLKNCSRLLLVILGFFSLGLCVGITVIYHNNVLMYLNDYGKVGCFFCTSILGAIGILLLSKGIQHNMIIEAFGRRSLCIMGIQFSVYLFVAWVFDHSNKLSMYQCFPMNIIFIVAAVIISFGISCFLCKYFPLFAGKYKNEEI